ncbi:hypothetical protein AUJ14_03850 [Candidatus Micrarchaeota archaeon CG1_02_55_22]|nr:MAG: hypothetical protein AUJ14_03850 [Candidatus Micrarchaeota archaeon CG1_02_55_22]
MSKTVLPGERVGYSEEVVATGRTFEDNGVIYSAAAGALEEKPAEHAVTVVPAKATRALRKGDLVYGIISDIFESIALVEFNALPLRDGTVPAQSDKMAILRVSELMPSYVESIRDFLCVGDVLKAEVVAASSTGINITLKGEGLGIVKAHWSRRRNDLVIGSQRSQGSPSGSSSFRGSDRPPRREGSFRREGSKPFGQRKTSPSFGGPSRPGPKLERRYSR